KYIANENIDIFRVVKFERALRSDRGREIEILKELPDGKLAQLRARDAIALLAEPPDIERLAAKGEEEARACRERQRADMADQHVIGMILMKADLVRRP